MTGSGHSITLRQRIPAARTRVFEAFTRPEALVQWFTPSPDISLEILDFDFAPQGAFRFCFTMPGDVQKRVGGSYERIAPPEEIVFSWVWEAPDQHAGMPTRVRVRFEENGDATEVVLTHERLVSEEVAARHGDGWSGMFKRLDAAFTQDANALSSAPGEPADA